MYIELYGSHATYKLRYLSRYCHLKRDESNSDLIATWLNSLYGRTFEVGEYSNLSSLLERAFFFKCGTMYTSSTAQGGGGSFKNRKPIGEVGCCESGKAERSHWWIERRLISLTLSLCLSLFLSLSLTTYLPTYLSIYLSFYHLSIFQSD